MIFCRSGTLSYIFNNFRGTRAFSDVVAEAKQAGYTEPDPRDDLSGTDVARKVLPSSILFRLFDDFMPSCCLMITPPELLFYYLLIHE